MSTIRVRRPVVRGYQEQELEDAAAHVRAGGHAIVWESPRIARLVVPKPNDADDYDLGQWAILDLRKSRYKVLQQGPLAGLATTKVPSECLPVVRRRIERDAVHRGSQRNVAFDCLACGACCRDNRVELTERDFARFDEGGRSDLYRMPYARRQDGALVLRLLADKACRHLGGDNKCGIYELRPDACRVFPVASECCLSSREMELRVYDGASPKAADRTA